MLLPEFDIEIATTRRVLERVPDDGDKGSWKPHEKAFPLAHLAQLVARMPGWVAMVTDRDEIDIAPKDGPKFPGYSVEKTSSLLEEFDRNAVAGREAIARTTDETFGQPWTFKAAGQELFTQGKYLALRTSVFNHLVHHRAQLGVYLRLLDEKVPSMYGPTADDHVGTR
jgi:uncharacterized damage-inducible protein DinB